MKELSALFESGDYSMENDIVLDKYRISIEQKHKSAVKSAADILEQIEIYDLTKGLFV